MTVLVHRMMLCLLCALCWGSVVVQAAPSKPVRTATAADVEALIQKARRASAQGQFARMRQALEQAQQRLEQSASIGKSERLWLWVHLLWSKYYRAQGMLPTVLSLEGEVDPSLIAGQISRLKVATIAQEKGLFHLRQYNRLLRSLASQAGSKNALVLVYSMSQEGILQNRVAILKLRLFRLQSAMRNWSRHQRTKRKQIAQLRREEQRLQQIRRLQVGAQDLLQRQGAALAQARQLAAQFQQTWLRRQRQTKILRYTGLITVAVGGLTIVVGTGLYLNADAWAVEDVEKKYSLNEALRWQQWGIGFWAGGGALLAIGFGMWVPGMLLRPTKQQRQQGLYRAHEGFLEWEQKQIPSKPPARRPQSHKAKPLRERALSQVSL